MRQPTYSERLLAELDAIAQTYSEILADSGIKYVNPNRWDSDVVFFGFADYGWVDSDENLEAARMALLRRLRDWTPRFRLLFTHPTPEVAERFKKGIDHLEGWLVRDGGWDHEIPQTIEGSAGQNPGNCRRLARTHKPAAAR